MYGERLAALKLTQLQVVTILAGWNDASIESLLRGEVSPPSHESIARAMLSYAELPQRPAEPILPRAEPSEDMDWG